MMQLAIETRTVVPGNYIVPDCLVKLVLVKPTWKSRAFPFFEMRSSQCLYSCLLVFSVNWRFAFRLPVFLRQ